MKWNTQRCLTQRDCLVKVFPTTRLLNEVLAWKPDGILLSNGPGDPCATPKSVELVKEVVNAALPGFGIVWDTSSWRKAWAWQRKRCTMGTADQPPGKRPYHGS